jgi:GNAT superfamily N-acetyltransferase
MFNDQPFGLVENIVVSHATRGKGVGRALLQHIEELALRHNCSKLMLLSATARQDAHRFFESAGFNGSTKRGFVKYRRSFSAA